jgi:hypothetical protein
VVVLIFAIVIPLGETQRRNAMDKLPFIDPFGAPEILVDGVAYREWVGSDMIRFGMFARDHGETILRLKLVIPAVVCSLEQRETAAMMKRAPRRTLVM